MDLPARERSIISILKGGRGLKSGRSGGRRELKGMVGIL